MHNRTLNYQIITAYQMKVALCFSLSTHAYMTHLVDYYKRDDIFWIIISTGQYVFYVIYLSISI